MRLSLLSAFLLFSSFIKGQDFSNVAPTNGMNFSNGQNIFEGGGGISFGDFNADGWDDLTFATERGEEMRFFQNDGDGTFTEVFLNIPSNTEETKQVLWVDYDNDGDKDFFATAFAEINRLYENDGSLNFTDVTELRGLPVSNEYKHHETYGANFGDYNGDGWLDLYITNYGVSSGIQNYFYQNIGGQFTDITDSLDCSGGLRQSFCSVFSDFNNDNKPDLYIANDRFEYLNVMYMNDGDDGFTDESSSSGSDIGIYAMNTGAADFDQDGDLDIYVTNIGPSSLLVNNGDGTFTDMADALGVLFAPRTGWGGNFFDFDNDQDLDLYVCSMINNTNLPNALYVNDGNGSFSEPLFNSGGLAGEDHIVSFVNAIADIDNDGRLDIAVSNGSEWDVMLWHNDETDVGNWLKIKLNGTVSNRDGINSWIEVYAAGEKWVQYSQTSQAYLAQNSDKYHFGLGNISTVDSVVVRWPSGIVDRRQFVTTNQTINITETDNPLPLKLLAFGAKKYGQNEALLTWITTDEKNVSHFEVQRSEDGVLFAPISEVKAKNTLSSVQHYRYMDEALKQDQTYYYKLNIVDFDGYSERSEIRQVYISEDEHESNIKIYPNPVSGNIFNLSMEGKALHDLDLVVYSMDGSIIFQGKKETFSKQQNWGINVQGWANGMYTVQLSHATNHEIYKLIIAQ